MLRFDSRCLHNRRDWLHSPVTLLLGDKDTGIELVYNLVNLEMALATAIAFEADWSWVYEIHWSDHKGTYRFSMQKATISFLTREV